MPRRLCALFVLLLAAACARAPRIPPDPSAFACRRVIPDGQSVTWTSPAETRNRHALADWCEAVGPVLYEPDPRRAGGRTLDRLAIVSWNTHVGGGDLDALITSVRRGDFTNGEPCDDFVLLLQEMYRHGDGVPQHPTIHAAIPGRIVDRSHAAHAHDVRRFANERGLAVLYAPSMRNGIAPDDPEDRGNAIVSTLPLEAPAIIELPLERQRRVVTVATISGHTSTHEPWRVRLADVHLDTALALTRGGPLAARRRQVEALITALSNGPDAGSPLIVAGDFNTWLGAREPAIAALRRAFPDAPPAFDKATWIGPLGLRATLDFVFARGRLQSIRVQRLPNRFGSDHYPLLAVVSF